jgi:hypothetical protein
MTLGTRSIAFVMFIFLKAKSHQLLVYWGHNDKLSCRAEPGDILLPRRAHVPIELAPTRSTAAPCSADENA